MTFQVRTSQCLLSAAFQSTVTFWEIMQKTRTGTESNQRRAFFRNKDVQSGDCKITSITLRPALSIQSFHRFKLCFCLVYRGRIVGAFVTLWWRIVTCKSRHVFLMAYYYPWNYRFIFTKSIALYSLWLVCTIFFLFLWVPISVL